MVTQEILKSLLSYNPDTGSFVWRVRRSPKVFPGSIAGRPSTSGHIQIKVMGRIYEAHRLAWLYVTGEWPNGFIDHKDRNPVNNRFANLRIATRSQNGANRTPQSNNSSGVPGVYWSKRDEVWRATIMISKRKKHLGSFKDISGAIAARKKAEVDYFGEFRACES